MIMRATIQILDAALDKLETRKSRYHSLGSYVVCCVANSNVAHNINMLYPAKSISKFTMIFYLCLTKGIYNQGNCINEFLFICVVCHEGVSKFLNFPVGKIHLIAPWCDKSWKYT